MSESCPRPGPGASAQHALRRRAVLPIAGEAGILGVCAEDLVRFWTLPVARSHPPGSEWSRGFARSRSRPATICWARLSTEPARIEDITASSSAPNSKPRTAERGSDSSARQNEALTIASPTMRFRLSSDIFLSILPPERRGRCLRGMASAPRSRHSSWSLTAFWLSDSLPRRMIIRRDPPRQASQQGML
jgi:hypothetical protein